VFRFGFATKNSSGNAQNEKGVNEAAEEKTKRKQEKDQLRDELLER
jgi:hypothetical protein